jgi:hypothetical protein
MKAMTPSLLPLQMDMGAFSAAELASLVPDVRRELLNTYLKGVYHRLTGPDPQPVFIPQNAPYGDSDRGLILIAAWMA